MLNKKKIGELLTEAKLINEEQLKVALKEQNDFSSLKLGEILVAHGWLKKDTVKFFCDELKNYNLKNYISRKNRLIGENLLKAGLLSEKDLKNILHQQEQIELKFGAIAVLQGKINKQTLEFFVKHCSLYSCQNNIRKKKVDNRIKKFSHNLREKKDIDLEDIRWID